MLFYVEVLHMVARKQRCEEQLFKNFTSSTKLILLVVTLASTISKNTFKIRMHYSRVRTARFRRRHYNSVVGGGTLGPYPLKGTGDQTGSDIIPPPLWIDMCKIITSPQPRLRR